MSIFFKNFISLLMFCLPISQSIAKEDLNEPLTITQYDAAIADLNKLQELHKFEWIDFKPQPETKRNIVQLFNDPRFANESPQLHSAAITIAANTELLHFEKPSDIINKIDKWFPHDIQERRKAFESNIPYLTNKYFLNNPLTLDGPYRFWDDDSTAFLTLWNCMPRTAWFRPNFDPSNPALADYNEALAGVVARGNSSYDSSFDRCIEENNATEEMIWVKPGPNGNTLSEAEGKIEYEKQMATRHETAIRVKAILAKRFPQWINSIQFNAMYWHRAR